MEGPAPLLGAAGLGGVPAGGLPILAAIFLAPLAALRAGKNDTTGGKNDNGEGNNHTPRRPVSAALCDLWTALSALACFAALFCCELDFGGLARLAASGESPVSHISAANATAALPNEAAASVVGETNDALAGQCLAASLVLGTAMALELMNVVARRGAGRANNDARRNGRRRGICVLYDLPDSEAMVLVYFVLFLVYITTYFDRDGSLLGLIFADPFAVDGGSLGGGIVVKGGAYRPVSTIRYMEWMVASPLLMSLVGRALPRKTSKDGTERDVDLEAKLRPGLTLTVVYIAVAWLALPITDVTWRWALIVVSFVGFLLSTSDQLSSWMRHVDWDAPRAGTAALLLKIQIGVYFSYGMVYLLGPVFDVLSPVAEQGVVTFADSTIKIACSAFLSAMRYADALEDARRERNRASNIAEDLKQMILTASAPIFAINRSFRVELWNDKFASLTGLTAKDVLGRRMEELLSAECREEVFSVLRDRMKGIGGSDNFHCEFDLGRIANGGASTAKGRVVSVIMSATAKHDSGGLIVGVVGIGQDRTEVTRYKVIEQKQNEFMGVISHELKSPLHGIIGLAENLSQSEEKKGRKEQLKLIRSCATRLIDLVSNIMEMSKLRSGGGEGGSVGADGDGDASILPMRQLRKEPVDISSIVSEVCFLVKSSTDKANRPLLNPLCEMVNKLPNSTKSRRRLPIVEGDAYKITQVFYNLITNACKFCSSGRINISAKVLVAEERLEISIEDTGIGIKPEAIKRIFEPFEQESNSSKRSFGGIGLGLAISREVAIMHGGDLTVESTIGKGSTFTLSLPVTEEAIALSLEPGKGSDSLSSSSANAAQTTLSRRISDNALSSRDRLEPSFEISTQKKVILSVDDDIVNQEVIKSTLSNNYEIHVAMNGYDAIEYFSSNSTLPDLVLLDVMMPGLDGFEVLKHIREDLGLSPAELPVIMVSAMEPADKAVIKSLSKGSNDYVSKPFDPDIVRARVGIATEVKRLRQLEHDNLYRNRLLHDILPAHIVDKLVDGEGKATGMSEKHDQVSILFADIVGWTPMSEKVPTDSLIALLNTLFSEFDELTNKHNVYKADTIGDCYIVAAGHEGGAAFDATLRVVHFAIDMLEATKRVKPPRGMKLQLRVGIHTGAAYSGVVGTKVPKYTFFGDTVNTASRMETSGVSNCINLSSSARDALVQEVRVHHSEPVEHWLQSFRASIVERGPVNVKGKGMMEMYLICPPGVSPPMARTLAGRRSSRMSHETDSNSNSPLPQQPQLARLSSRRSRPGSRDSLISLRSSFNSLNQSHRSNDRWGSDGVDLAAAQREIAGSNQILLNAAWRDVERLKAELLEAKSEIGRLSGGGPTSSQTVEELKLKLMVTTRRLAQARQSLLQKEMELDEKELELCRALSRGGIPSTVQPTVRQEEEIMSHALERAQRILAENGSTQPTVPNTPATRSHENEAGHDDDDDLTDDSGS